MATICARAISGSVGYILNLYISFQSKLNPGREMVRYSIVFVCQMAASGILVSLLSVIPIPTIIVKAIIDTIFFCRLQHSKELGICGYISIKIIILIPDISLSILRILRYYWISWRCIT